MLQPFFIALQFLTIVPIHLRQIPDAKTTGRSLLCYPLVGLLLGGVLASLGWLLSDAPAAVVAALLLAIWVIATGGLHLDGLADSADAWVGGQGDRDKTLTIMKDPRCGPAGVVALVLLLLLKFAALEHLVTSENWQALLLAPLLGRTLLILLFLTTPYVRPDGLGTRLASNFPRRASAGVVLFIFAVLPLTMGAALFWLLCLLLAIFFLLRMFMQQRIHGTTGDTAGALVEISELAVLLIAALMMNNVAIK